MVNHQHSTDSSDSSGPFRDLVAVHFNYKGVAYTVDLDPAEAAAFDAAMAPYIAAGRRVGGGRAPRNASGPSVTS